MIRSRIALLAGALALTGFTGDGRRRKRTTAAVSWRRTPEPGSSVMRSHGPVGSH